MTDVIELNKCGMVVSEFKSPCKLKLTVCVMKSHIARSAARPATQLKNGQKHLQTDRGRIYTFNMFKKKR